MVLSLLLPDVRVEEECVAMPSFSQGIWDPIQVFIAVEQNPPKPLPQLSLLGLVCSPLPHGAPCMRLHCYEQFSQGCWDLNSCLCGGNVDN